MSPQGELQSSKLGRQPNLHDFMIQKKEYNLIQILDILLLYKIYPFYNRRQETLCEVKQMTFMFIKTNFNMTFKLLIYK